MVIAEKKQAEIKIRNKLFHGFIKIHLDESGAAWIIFIFNKIRSISIVYISIWMFRDTFAHI